MTKINLFIFGQIFKSVPNSPNHTNKLQPDPQPGCSVQLGSPRHPLPPFSLWHTWRTLFMRKFLRPKSKRTLAESWTCLFDFAFHNNFLLPSFPGILARNLIPISPNLDRFAKISTKGRVPKKNPEKVWSFAKKYPKKYWKVLKKALKNVLKKVLKLKRTKKSTL